MSRLVPGPFPALVARAFEELDRNQSIFTLPARKFVLNNRGHDTSAVIHGRRVAAPLGPSAGPHTQMAQNIVLAWLAGARVMELKTVQRLDTLRIPRPCIEVRAAGYNVEWSQELKIEQSLEEYVKASMLIEMLAYSFGVDRACLFDLSVGYDFEGIRSERMRWFMQNMIDARATIEELRKQVPAAFGYLRGIDFTSRIASTVTLSTFHGCPVEEIERIADFLMSEMHLDCTIKLNPTLLGSETVDEILHDRLGYDEIHVPGDAYRKDPVWQQAVDIVGRLQARARELGRSFAIKLTNTLVIENRSDFLPRSERVAYLSGPPLHVLAMHLVRRFRRTFGAALPISFSAGIDRFNYPDAVRLGLAPVTVCTDLLRQGGYGRLHSYASDLEQRMSAAGAGSLAEFIDLDAIDAYVESLDSNPRYRADSTRAPRKTGHPIGVFDCAACDLCVGVCPNAAIFTIPPHRIAIFDDWCNDCGNCEMFCPDVGAPNRVKPRLSTDESTWTGYENLRRAVFDPSHVNSINCLALEES